MGEQKRNPLESLRATSMYFTPGESGYIRGSLGRPERKSDHEIFMRIRNGVKGLKESRSFGKPILLDARQTQIVLSRLEHDGVSIGSPIEHTTDLTTDRKQGSETFQLSDGLYLRVTYGEPMDPDIQGFSITAYPTGGLLSGEKPEQVPAETFFKPTTPEEIAEDRRKYLEKIRIDKFFQEEQKKRSE